MVGDGFIGGDRARRGGEHGGERTKRGANEGPAAGRCHAASYDIMRRRTTSRGDAASRQGPGGSRASGTWGWLRGRPWRGGGCVCERVRASHTRVRGGSVPPTRVCGGPLRHPGGGVPVGRQAGAPYPGSGGPAGGAPPWPRGTRSRPKSWSPAWRGGGGMLEGTPVSWHPSPPPYRPPRYPHKCPRTPPSSPQRQMPQDPPVALLPPVTPP